MASISPVCSDGSTAEDVSEQSATGSAGATGDTASSPLQDITEAELCFVSPAAAYLPSECRLARAVWIGPPICPPLSGRAVTSGATPPTVVIHMPAFAEELYGNRAIIAWELAASDGVCNLILMAPFYAARRPAGQHGHFIRSVHHFLLQGFALSVEAALLAEWCMTSMPGCRVTLSGFSYGGAMAGTSACFAAGILPPALRSRLACVPCVGSATPAVVADGVLQSEVDWRAVRAGMLHVQASGQLPRLACVDAAELQALCDARDARVFLHALLMTVHTRKIVDTLLSRSVRAGSVMPISGAAAMPAGNDSEEATPLLAALATVRAEHDQYVKLAYAVDQHVQLARITARGKAHARVLGGGHVTAFLSRSEVFTSAVRKVVEMMHERM